MKKRYFVLFLISVVGCNNSRRETHMEETNGSMKPKEDSLTIQFANGVITQNYNPDNYDADRNIKGEFCFITNYPMGTKAILSTYHYIESAGDASEFAPFYDTIELTPSLCYDIIGPHAFGTIGFRIPLELQSEKIKGVLNNRNWIEEVFFNVINTDISKDTVNVEVQQSIP